jgi:dsDNA-specific endonuclease/ATPase MutS2
MQNAQVTAFLQQVKVLTQSPASVQLLNAFNEAEANANTAQEQDDAVNACANYYSSVTGFSPAELANITTALADVTSDGAYITYLHYAINDVIADWEASL